MQLNSTTRRTIAKVFDRLDYETLAQVYCDQGGGAFWRDRRGPCRRLGMHIARVLRSRLRPKGRSLYIGAGVAEVPVLVMEALELTRGVTPYNLRKKEVAVLSQACHGLPFRFKGETAEKARGRFDHLWMVSVLNDPERFPELSALSYGRANPVAFNPNQFSRERRKVQEVVRACLRKLSRPGLVTTSVEEVPWVTDWCSRRRIPCVVEEEEYPTAIVGDPICFIRIG